MPSFICIAVESVDDISLTANESPLIAPATFKPSAMFTALEPSAMIVPLITRLSLIVTPDESVDCKDSKSPIFAVIFPVAVRLLNPVISLDASTTTALLAATVPAVIVSIVSNSASVNTAAPTVNAVPVTIPPDVIAPVKFAVLPPTTAPLISTASCILMFEESVDLIMFVSTVPAVTSPSRFATMVAVLESVTAVAVPTDVDNTALNLSSPSFQ